LEADEHNVQRAVDALVKLQPGAVSAAAAKKAAASGDVNVAEAAMATCLEAMLATGAEVVYVISGGNGGDGDGKALVSAMDKASWQSTVHSVRLASDVDVGVPMPGLKEVAGLTEGVYREIACYADIVDYQKQVASGTSAAGGFAATGGTIRDVGAGVTGGGRKPWGSGSHHTKDARRATPHELIDHFFTSNLNEVVMQMLSCGICVGTADGGLADGEDGPPINTGQGWPMKRLKHWLLKHGSGAGGGSNKTGSDRGNRGAPTSGATAATGGEWDSAKGWRSGRAQQTSTVAGGTNIHERRWKRQQKVLAGHQRAAAAHRQRRLDTATTKARSAERYVAQVSEYGSGGGGGMGAKERQRQVAREHDEKGYGGMAIRRANRVLEVIGRLPLDDAEEFFKPIADDEGMVGENELLDALSGLAGDGGATAEDVSALLDTMGVEVGGNRKISYRDFLPEF